MAAAFIFVISLFALVQFCVSYVRSLLAATNALPLSEETREISGIQDHLVSGEDFARLMTLADLCPEQGAPRAEVLAVRAYYTLLGLAAKILPFSANWVERETQGCSYFAAVTLDRRIWMNRAVFAGRDSLDA